MTTTHIDVLPETPSEHGGRLGRNPQYDNRNEAHRLKGLMAVRPVGALKDKVWSRRLAVMDQGDIGACTVYAGIGAIRTKPTTGTLTSKARRLLENPVALYSEVTANDEFQGAYPPEDTGSSVLAAMKVFKAKGVIKGYQWAYEPEEAATALATLGPGEIGTIWTSDMDRPNDKGVVRPSGFLRGGHAYQAIGRIWDVDQWYWIFVNSWGPDWPKKPALGKRGHFAMTERDVFNLLENQGEFVIPTLTP